ncbi:uncharacterized protein LOC109709404 [Ananas comosus]|uniref:Uncharacterized protein LOC109709404 n=1 Tax=Ananas comosus TaxID=4615 RepID=A0A6P5ETX9_ANACO|nr:uncharacterized protein LOC109709404 [Ananas comosus]
MRWRPWPPMAARKFRARVGVRRLEGAPAGARVAAEVRWRGPRATALGSLRRRARRSHRTREEDVRVDEEGRGAAAAAAAEWENEGFESDVTLTSQKEGVCGAFYPWEVSFVVVVVSNNGSKSKPSVLGTASLNLAEYASAAQEEMEMILPILLNGVDVVDPPTLHITLYLAEVRFQEEPLGTVQRPITPSPLSPSSGDAPPTEKDEPSVFRAGLRKVNILKKIVSSQSPKKTSKDDEGSEENTIYPLDTDSLDDDLDEREQEESNKEEDNSSVRKSFSYGTLAFANNLGGLRREDVDCVYYSHRRSDVGFSNREEMASSVQEQQFVFQGSKRSILPWKRRKLSFRSPKNKGEPLLKKGYREEGGDDIDYDRRVMSSPEKSLFGGKQKDEDISLGRSSFSDFGDDNFTVGSWESKEIVSRDGHLKLSTQIFFASIDQRSERAAGESACAALVAVIADWLHANPNMMPIQSQFDSLIREGSLEWRRLCENPLYLKHFPDKHFDLETVLQANICPLSVFPSNSFIGFFQPNGAGDDNGFEFLHGAMSFDSIWDEISRAGSDATFDESPQIYIVSWNDHFFVLKVERDAYYIIDTLGERLHEGCNQAYILKFDKNTLIHRTPTEKKSTSGDSNSDRAVDGELVCKGKESCKEYIKSFLSAIPVRELQADIKKGLLASTPLHHRLQIEFHYTESSSKEADSASSSPEAGSVSQLSWPVNPGAACARTPAVIVV